MWQVKRLPSEITVDDSLRKERIRAFKYSTSILTCGKIAKVYFLKKLQKPTINCEF